MCIVVDFDSILIDNWPSLTFVDLFTFHVTTNGWIVLRAKTRRISSFQPLIFFMPGPSTWNDGKQVCTVHIYNAVTGTARILTSYLSGLIEINFPKTIRDDVFHRNASEYRCTFLGTFYFFVTLDCFSTSPPKSDFRIGGCCLFRKIYECSIADIFTLRHYSALSY